MAKQVSNILSTNPINIVKFPYVLFCFMLLTGFAKDEEILSGQALVAACEEGATPEQPSQYCMQYVFGLVQTIETLQASDVDEAIFCIDPQIIGLPEVTQNIVRWLQDRSERLHEDAYLLVTQALHQLYPCPENGHLTEASPIGETV